MELIYKFLEILFATGGFYTSLAALLFAFGAILISFLALLIEVIAKIKKEGSRGKLLNIAETLKIMGVAVSLTSIISYLIGAMNNLFMSLI